MILTLPEADMEELWEERKMAFKQLEGQRKGIGQEAAGINLLSYYRMYVACTAAKIQSFIANNLLVLQHFQTTL